MWRDDLKELKDLIKKNTEVLRKKLDRNEVVECYVCGCLVKREPDNFIRVDSYIQENPNWGKAIIREDIYMCRMCRAEGSQRFEEDRHV